MERQTTIKYCVTGYLDDTLIWYAKWLYSKHISLCNCMVAI